MSLGVLLCTLLLLVAGASAQSTKAELRGTVRDPAGLPVVSAQVDLTHRSTGVTSTVPSGKDGGYQFLALMPGEYRLSISHPGFAPFKRDGLILRVADRLAVDLELKLGEASQAVEVIAGTPLLQTTSGTVGFVVEQRRTVTLPLDGRNFVQLIALSPGVNLPPGSVLPRINGSRPRVSEYIYDGISVLQPEPGQVALRLVTVLVKSPGYRRSFESPRARMGSLVTVTGVVTRTGGSQSSRGVPLT